MVFLIVIHAGLIIWASTLAISFLYRVDLSSESVKVRRDIGSCNQECRCAVCGETLLLVEEVELTFFSLPPSQVNDALEVFGDRDMDPLLWMDGSNDGSIRQAHIRIGSRTSV